METTKIEMNKNFNTAVEEKAKQQQPLITSVEQRIEDDGEEQQPLIMSSDEEQKKKRIFVAVDESDDSFYVLRWVLDNLINKHLSSNETDELQDHLTLLHVMPRLPQYVFPGAPVVMPAVSIMESATKVQKEHATELVTKAMQICKEKNVEAKILIREGDPKEIICQATEDMHVHLLVVGSRGRGKIKRALLGSVSDYCAHHAKCPVVIVKPPKESHN